MPQTITSIKPGTNLRQQVDELLSNGQYEIAEEHLKELLAHNGDDPIILNALGTVHAQKRDYVKAEELINRAILRNPEFADAHYNLGLLFSRQSRQSDAIQCLLRVVELKPADSVAHNDLGALYYAQGKILLAKGHFIKALEANPQYKNAFINLFEIYWDSGERDKAVKLMSNFMESAGQPVAKASTCMTILNVHKAIARLEQGDAGIVPSPTNWAESIRPAKTASTEIEDMFMKHVPEDLRHKKTGMNIAVVADFNVAGQLSLLFRYLNRHTIHKARMVILKGDYLSYDRDLVLSDGQRPEFDEAQKIIHNADFYHIGRFPMNFGQIDWSKILRPDNCVVQYYGSEIRGHAKLIYQWHRDNNILGISCWDYTMIEDAPLLYHVNTMCDTERVKPCVPQTEIVRICHPPTNRAFKKIDLFLGVMEDLKNRYPVEAELIEGRSNEECLEIKRRCHITYDQISVGIYGLSAIESMAAGHAVLCGMSNFATSYFPNNPIIHVHENNLKEKIEYLLQNRDEIVKAGKAGADWVREHHNPDKIVGQICWLYDMARHGHRFIEDRDAFMIHEAQAGGE
jgi:Flp pilus assembly protein TadD